MKKKNKNLKLREFIDNYFKATYTKLFVKTIFKNYLNYILNDSAYPLLLKLELEINDTFQNCYIMESDELIQIIKIIIKSESDKILQSIEELTKSDKEKIFKKIEGSLKSLAYIKDDFKSLFYTRMLSDSNTLRKLIENQIYYNYTRNKPTFPEFKSLKIPLIEYHRYEIFNSPKCNFMKVPQEKYDFKFPTNQFVNLLISIRINFESKKYKIALEALEDLLYIFEGYYIEISIRIARSIILYEKNEFENALKELIYAKNILNKQHYNENDYLEMEFIILSIQHEYMERLKNYDKANEILDKLCNIYPQVFIKKFYYNNIVDLHKIINAKLSLKIGYCNWLLTYGNKLIVVEIPNSLIMRFAATRDLLLDNLVDFGNTPNLFGLTN